MAIDLVDECYKSGENEKVHFTLNKELIIGIEKLAIDVANIKNGISIL